MYIHMFNVYLYVCLRYVYTVHKFVSPLLFPLYIISTFSFPHFRISLCFYFSNVKFNRCSTLYFLRLQLEIDGSPSQKEQYHVHIPTIFSRYYQLNSMHFELQKIKIYERVLYVYILYFVYKNHYFYTISVFESFSFVFMFFLLRFLFACKIDR